MKKTRKQKILIKISLSIFVALLVLGYGLFQARNLINGPEINVLTPKTGENLSNPLVLITGTAKNIVYISLNDRQIYIDKQGNFSEKLLVPSGYTIIKLAAQDKFKRSIEKLIELNYSGKEITKPVETLATSTQATSSQKIIQ